MRRLSHLVMLVLFARTAAAQELGSLVSPGKLSRAHASLEGLASCKKCHAPGKKVTASLCLACHEPIARRIAAKRGVHRDVKDDCVTCHVEHGGENGDLRPLETKKFDHRAETGFAVDGSHASLACARCHATRSFLEARTECAACHKDVHQGRLGSDCARCHPTSVAFRETAKAFDHARTAFPLTSLHSGVRCERCHTARGSYRGIAFASCADCHRDPHRKPLGTCATCHTTEGFRKGPFPALDHAKTGYALVGRHENVACAKCHVERAVKVRPAADRCATCHVDVHKGQFREDCGACHQPTGFGRGAFDHAVRTRFRLDGAHGSVPCASCHKGAAPTAVSARRTVDFRGAKAACASCHIDAHKGTLGPACEACHSTRSFAVPAFTHPKLPEFFAGSHAPVACAKCHGEDVTAGTVTLARGRTIPVRRFRGAPSDCAACHRDPHRGELGADCQSCHAVDGAKFAPVRFSHEKSSFALTGRHQKVDCADCHKKDRGVARLKGISSECRACHRDVHLGQLGARCETCHSTSTFLLPKYKHLEVRERAGFFDGKHASAPCQVCHKRVEAAFASGRGTAVRYRGVNSACASCHEDVHRGTLGSRCGSCHVPLQWKSASRAFHKGGVFPLEGKHLSVPCASCHPKGVLKGTPTRCYDCHWIRRKDDRFATRLGTDCESCHRPTAWASVSWDHASRTSFPLAPPHRGVACESCHRAGVFAGTSTDCYACHQADFAKAKRPDHVAAGFPSQCTTCHAAAASSWQGATFDHAGVFPLAGVHATQPCAACHKNDVYKGTARDCVGCHRSDFEKTKSPNHLAAGFATACESCHKRSDASFKQGTYPHLVWPLVGSHTSQSCSTCHATNVYRGLPSDCVSCHRTAYAQSQQPNHMAAGFPITCQICHKLSDATWHLGTFDHNGAFPLVGVHATQPCAACHKNNVYKGTPRDCVGCHRAAYDQSKNPNHPAAGFPVTCETCHKASDSDWHQAHFDHSGAFPLVGVHATQPCAACHKNNVYKGTPRDCVGCHRAAYDQSKNPNHPAAGFPVTCETCHKASDADWHQAHFDHSGAFPLIGVHATQPCAACHKNNVYKGTPRDCSGCHLAAYQQAKNPNHVAAGFATACASCHRATDTTWQLGTYPHNVWPLLGSHATQSCVTCHTSNVYRGLSTLCVSCHLSAFQKAQSPNHLAAGFPTTCEVCHRVSDTSWHQAHFDHAGIFPLVGLHATQACAACHKNGVYKGTPRDCAGCHLAVYQQARNPNHIAAGFPTTCETCHKATDTSWQQGRFNHTWFPITSGRHAVPCASCHTTPNNFVVFNCLACHDRSRTDANHRGVTGYRYDSQACYACHPQGRS